MDEEDFTSFEMPEQYGQSYAPDSLMSNIGYSTPSADMSTMPSDFDSLQYMYDNPTNIDGQSYGQSFAPGSVMDNLTQQNTPSWGMSTPGGEIPNNQGGISQALSDLFNNKKTMTGIGVLFEGFQNMQKANAMQGLASRMQGAMDPFGKQRPGYQAQLAASIQNPYSSPIVRAQVEQLQRAQAAKDAAAGRRSNSATSSPAILAAQAQIAQNYINSLMQPAGANISPSGLSSLLQTQQQGINSGINGFVSPLLSAAGYATGNNNTANDLATIKTKLGM
jgi:hypothetical protein